MATAKVKSYKRRSKTGKTVTVKQHSRKVKEGAVIDGVKPSRYKGVDMYVMPQFSKASTGEEYKRTIDGSGKSPEEVQKILEADKRAGFPRPTELKNKEDWKRYRAGTFKSKPTPAKVAPHAPLKPQDYFDNFLSSIDRFIMKSKRKR